MTVFLGGLGLMSLHNPFTEFVGMVSGKTDIKSMLCLIVFLIVTFVLAYLTNPTESSFRTYLTEQSFRQHLSRLDESSEEDVKRQPNSGSHSSTRRNPAADALPYDNTSSPFHFANRASIALRTPKHVFHSFGLFTIAAMVPLARSVHPHERDTSMISDSWYIGAFGRWWRGGVIEAWYQDVIARSKDEESWSSGILSMKNLDRLNDYNGLPLSQKTILPRVYPKGSPPKLRNRDKSGQKAAVPPARSLTPPPLPKSVSLPLHTARLSSGLDRSSCNSTLQNHVDNSAEQVHISSLASRSPSTLFDHSPRIAEVLRQISQSKAAVLDLHAQIGDCQSCAIESHSLLQRELDSCRERKRQEDVSKLESKSRTKALDDSRRNAESSRRDAEKKLKAAHNARDGATQRMDLLDQQISKLQQQLVDGEAFIRQSDENISEAKGELELALEQKKREIKATEDVVATLNQHARELEDKVAEAKKKLAHLKDLNETRKPEILPQMNTGVYQELWTPSSYKAASDTNGLSIPETRERRASPVGFEAIHDLDTRPSLMIDPLARPDISAQGGAALNPSPTSIHHNGNSTQATLRANGYSIFDNSLVAAVPQHSTYDHRSTAFAPFGDLDGSQATGTLGIGVISPTSQSLIPSGLISSLDSGFGLPRSFQSESDAYLDREWRTGSAIRRDQSQTNDSQDLTMASSPISPSNKDQLSYDLDRVRYAPNQDGNDQRDYGTSHLRASDPMSMQRASWLNRTRSDPAPKNHVLEETDQPTSPVFEKAGPKRWFSVSHKDKSNKGLNPEAKVFSFTKRSPPQAFLSNPSFNVSPVNSTAVPYDALNPNGVGSGVVSTSTSVTSSFGCAFAPSPAERRALGGLSNASFERLPSLSNVGSMPSSPPHSDAIPAMVPQHAFPKISPAWLQSLPSRKANFSPWDDEELEPGPGSASGSSADGRQR